MQRKNKRGRWIVVLICFLFLLFHSTNLIQLAPISAQVLTSLNIDPDRFQIVITTGTIVGGLLVLLWGYLNDSHSRTRLLALAGFIWGSTSLLVGISPTYATFAMSYVSSAIDYGGSTGIFSLISDYFSPRNRGKIFGLLMAAQPLAYLLATILMNNLWIQVNWRFAMLAFGGVGFLMGWMVLLGIREPRRGQSEPALKDLNLSGKYLFEWDFAKNMLNQHGLWFLYAMGFFTSIPWFVLIRWMMPYLDTVRGLDFTDIFLIYLPPLFALMMGYPLGGVVGDWWAYVNKQGRAWIGVIGLGLAMVFFGLTFQITDVLSPTYLMLMVLAAFAMGMERPNVMAMIADVTLPELRSTAISIWTLFQLGGALAGPWFVRLLTKRVGLGTAIWWVCGAAWGLGLVLLLALVPRHSDDIESLRKHMAYRSWLEGRIEKDQGA